MSARQIRKRVEKIENSPEYRSRTSPVAIVLAEALSVEELLALQAKLKARPGTVIQDVLTADEMAELSTKMAAAQERLSCNGTVG